MPHSWRPTAPLLVIAAVLAVIAVSLGEHAVSSRHVLVGFNDNAVTENVASPRQTAALLSEIGARIDRVQVNWRSIEPQPGRYRLAAYDQIYRADLARGIRPLFVFGFAPQWATQRSCMAKIELCPPSPTAVRQAAEAAAELAQRYPRSAGIEIWNEPNTPFFWFPSANVAAYTRLLVACYQAIKRVAPSMPLAGGSLSNSPVLGPGYISLQSFLAGIYRDGGGHSMDAISIHPYPNPADISGATALISVEQALATRNAYGYKRTPLWITETGISTTGRDAVTAVAQGTALVHLYRVFSAIPAVRMIIFHTLVPPPGAPSDSDPGFAVVNSDFSPKPAFCALSAALDGRRRC